MVSDDRIGVNQFVYLLAPAKFLGGLTAYNRGSIGFDTAILVVDGIATAGFFGNITISSSAGTASKKIAPDAPPTQWTSYSGILSASEWGVSETAWASILADVTGIRVDLEPVGGRTGSCWL